MFLVTETGVVGPYKSIVEKEDRWCCDNVEFQKTVFQNSYTVEEYEQETPVDYSYRDNMVVSMRQARLALLASRFLDDVADAIAQLESPSKEQAQITWEYAVEVKRLDPFVLMLGPLLGLDDDALDTLFETAKGL